MGGFNYLQQQSLYSIIAGNGKLLIRCTLFFCAKNYLLSTGGRQLHSYISP